VIIWSYRDKSIIHLPSNASAPIIKVFLRYYSKIVSVYRIGICSSTWHPEIVPRVIIMIIIMIKKLKFCTNFEFFLPLTQLKGNVRVVQLSNDFIFFNCNQFFHVIQSFYRNGIIIIKEQKIGTVIKDLMFHLFLNFRNSIFKFFF